MNSTKEETRSPRRWSDASRRKLSVSMQGNQHFRGHKHTPETRSKMSATRTGRKKGHKDSPAVLAARKAANLKVGAAWRVANRERYLARRRQWRTANKELVAASAKRRWLRAEYGITVEDFNNLLISQGGACAICRRLLSVGGKRGGAARVDHSHATGRVRGLLCSPCNLGLGQFGETPVVLHLAAEYLEKFRV